MLETVVIPVGLALASYTLYTLIQMQGDLRAMRVTIIGENGDNGLNSRVKALEMRFGAQDVHMSKHDTQIAVLRGRDDG